VLRSTGAVDKFDQALITQNFNKFLEINSVEMERCKQLMAVKAYPRALHGCLLKPNKRLVAT
jgi:hypothetical protein